MYRTMPERSSRAANNDPQKTSVPLTIPMPLIEYPDGDLPTHLPSHPELDALMVLWREVRSSGDFTLDVMTRWATHLSIAVVLPDGRFQFRLFGSELSNI